MKGGEWLKNGMRSALYHAGVFGAWHRWRNRHALTVLMFHRVLPAQDPAFALAEREFTMSLEGFGRVLDFVQRHYSVVGLEALVQARASGGPLPANPLLITFDDGWRDTLLYAAPELQRRSLPALLFVASEAPTLPNPRWWQDALVAALAQPQAAQRLCRAAGLPVQAPGAAGQALAAYLGALPQAQRLAWLEQQAPGLLAQVPQRQMMDMCDLLQLERYGIAVGGHGHTHSPLSLCAQPGAELQASRALLAHWPQRACSMSFPHGACSQVLQEQARQAGFAWLFTSEPCLNAVAGAIGAGAVLGRVHLPENAWTCTRGRIAPARLATFLFLRPVLKAGR